MQDKNKLLFLKLFFYFLIIILISSLLMFSNLFFQLLDCNKENYSAISGCAGTLPFLILPIPFLLLLIFALIISVIFIKKKMRVLESENIAKADKKIMVLSLVLSTIFTTFIYFGVILNESMCHYAGDGKDNFQELRNQCYEKYSSTKPNPLFGFIFFYLIIFFISKIIKFIYFKINKKHEQLKS